MKRFRLNILICLLLTALFSALSAWLFISGKVPQGIFAAAGVMQCGGNLSAAAERLGINRQT
ncbi:MAG: hypothetical protein K2M27_11045, partial [Muribaculaceae bacterium]|nr:hypothetical protein [Muribaculaceae bacterium]